MDPVLAKISEIGIVPVIRIDNVEDAVPLGKALLAGGIPCAEVTFRTAEGEEAIRRMSKEVPEILVGAGTVLTTEQVDRAIDAGAKFIVSPGLNPRVVKYCVDKGIPVTPGCANPSDVEQALELGLNVVKFFPASQAGGLPYIKAMSAPYTSVKFMPTGGINADNLGEYLASDKILACGGSWMVSADMINAGEFDEITALCKQAVFTMLDFKLAHIGLNSPDEAAAKKAAATVEMIFGFAQKDGNSSIFAGKGFEIMKSMGRGKNGHIAISTPQMERAAAYLERNGIQVDEDSKKYDDNGKLTLVYLAEEVLGFAIHLVKA